ncbi:MAG: lactate racemase domain-containing protein [Sutterella wadsworthensis]
MAVQKYEFAYGRGTQSFEYDDADVLKVVRTEPQPILEDVKGHLLDMLEHPIGLPPLSEIVKPGDTVAFICNDPTRVANSFVFMPILVNELNRLGVPDANMRIVFALGTHRAMTHEEMVEQVGEEVAGRLPMFNSIATNADDFQYFGKTTLGTPVWINKLFCDGVLTGTIVHHFSGCSGGRSHAAGLFNNGNGSHEPQPHAVRQAGGLGAAPATTTRWKGRTLRQGTLALPERHPMLSTNSRISKHLRRLKKPVSSSMRYTEARFRVRPISSSLPAAAGQKTSMSIRCKRPWTMPPAPLRRAV